MYWIPIIFSSVESCHSSVKFCPKLGCQVAEVVEHRSRKVNNYPSGIHLVEGQTHPHGRRGSGAGLAQDLALGHGLRRGHTRQAAVSAPRTGWALSWEETWTKRGKARRLKSRGGKEKEQRTRSSLQGKCLVSALYAQLAGFSLICLLFLMNLLPAQVNQYLFLCKKYELLPCSLCSNNRMTNHTEYYRLISALSADISIIGWYRHYQLISALSADIGIIGWYRHYRLISALSVDISIIGW